MVGINIGMLSACESPFGGVKASIPSDAILLKDKENLLMAYLMNLGERLWP